MSSDITRKEWGSERLLHNAEFCAKVMTLERGARCSIHFHALKKEMFIVTKGAILIELWPQLSPEDFAIDDKIRPGLDLSNPAKMLVLTNQMPQQIGRYGIEIAGQPHESVYIDNNVPHRFIGLGDYNVFIEASTHDKAEDSYRLINSRSPDIR